MRFSIDEGGGIITFNIEESTNLDFDIADAVPEEFAHAAIYEYNFQLSGSNLKKNFPPNGNDEFEAKSVVGQIKSESLRFLETLPNDKVALSFGVKSFKSGNTKGFHSELQRWMRQQNAAAGQYGSNTINNAAPNLLNYLIKFYGKRK